MADGTPQRPAAVSGPGALSQRTDGGPGSSKQPIRVPTGGAYGEAKALTEQQQAAPMAAGGPGPDGRAPAAGGAVPGGDLFGPTTMPEQPIMTGVSNMPETAIPDAKAVLQAVYAAYPSPWIAMMLHD